MALLACGDGIRVSPPDLDDVSVTTPEDTQVAVAFALTAAVPGDVALTVVTPPSHGTLTGQGPTYNYQPAANYTGTDSVVVRAADAHGSSMATATITVGGVNDAPVANADSFATGFNLPLTVAKATLLANDTDVESATLIITGVAAATEGHGTPGIDGGNVVFTPEANFTGTATFTYAVSDGELTAVGNVTVSIGVNHAPVAVADTVTTDEDTTTAIAHAVLLANDTDADGQTLAITAVGAPQGGSVTRTDTEITFEPAPDFHGDASFEYTITDGLLTHVGTVTVTVASVNDAPVVTASAGAVAYLENADAVVLDADLSISDVDSFTLTGATVQIETGCTSPQDVLALAAPPDGVTVTGYDAASCTLSLTGAASLATYHEALRLVTYVNTSDAPSIAARSLRFTVDDGESANNTGSATRDLTVAALDDTPLAIDDAAAVAEDSDGTAIAVLANDLDLDGGPIAVSEVTQPAHGVVAVAGDGSGVTYTPNANDCNSTGAPDTFTYTLSPGGSSATVAVTVICVDDAPVAVDDSATVAEASLVNLIDVAANDTDIDGGPRTVASVTQPGHGSAAVGPEGVNVTYTPAAGYCNEIPNGPRDIFTYTLTGGSSATVSVQVTCACGLNKSTDFVVGSN